MPAGTPEPANVSTSKLKKDYVSYPSQLLNRHLVKSGLKNSSFSNSLGQGNIGSISSALSTNT